MPTAAIIIIGNEILSGRVKDVNSGYLASELRALGVDVKRISVIPDDTDAIAKEVSSASAMHDYVFTAGGIGPTHDDLTIEGVTKGFGLKTVKSDRMADLIRQRCGGALPEASVKMTELPEGAELIEQEPGRFPVIVLGNVYIFPGIPSFLRQKFSAIKNRFRSEPFHIRKIYLNDEECFIAGHLEKVASGFPDVLIGSYPNVEAGDYKVAVTLESTSTESLGRAFDELLRLIPPLVVVKTE